MYRIGYCSSVGVKFFLSQFNASSYSSCIFLLFISLSFEDTRKLKILSSVFYACIRPFRTFQHARIGFLEKCHENSIYFIHCSLLHSCAHIIICTTYMDCFISYQLDLMMSSMQDTCTAVNSNFSLLRMTYTREPTLLSIGFHALHI